MVSQPSSPTHFSAADETFTGDGGEGMGRAATTVSSLSLGQDSGNIIKTQPMPTQVESGSLGPTSTSGPRQMENMGGILDQTRSEKVYKLKESPLSRGNTLGSEGGSMKLHELTATCTTLSNRVSKLNNSPISRVLVLENELKNTMKIYNSVCLKLSQRLDKLEKKLKLKEKRKEASISKGKVSAQEDSPKQGRKNAEKEAESKGRQSEVELADQGISTNAYQTDSTTREKTTSPIREVPEDEFTLSQTLLAIKKSAIKDKGKGKMREEPEQTKTNFKNEKEAQETFDAELAQKLYQEELEAEQQERIEQDSIAQVRKNQIEFLVSQGFQKRIFFKMSYDEVDRIYEKEYKTIQDSSLQDSSPRNSKRAGMNIEQKFSKKQKAAELLRVKQEHGDEIEKNKMAAEKITVEEKAETAETTVCLEESSKNLKESGGPET
ncbi:hypothetical protein OROMI_008265 [Orobanche minor]